MNVTDIVKGTSRAPTFTLVDVDGDAVDMTSGTRSLSFRLMRQGGSSPDLTISPTWTTQASGEGYFPLTTAQTAALTAGAYSVEVIYADSATSEKIAVYRNNTWRVLETYTGTI